METTAIDDLDSMMGPAAVKKRLAKGLEATEIALNYYELEAGETFGFGYHRHPDQEEVFYVLDGTATFETEEGDVDVAAGEAVRFAPGEWQLGRNDGEEPVRALAIGAPKDDREAEIKRACENCETRTEHRVELADDRSAILAICTNCGTETGRYT
jgi:quercetin dioxygenase-like cupin family protein